MSTIDILHTRLNRCDYNLTRLPNISLAHAETLDLVFLSKPKIQFLKYDQCFWVAVNHKLYE